MPIMPKAFPKEFRDDVVAVARKAEASVAQVAKDFGISESCLHRWLSLADIEDGKRPGATKEESEALRELKKRNRLLEQENEVLRRAAAYLARDVLPK
jgi:transposase